MADNEAPDPITLPCGCFINPVVVDGERQLRISPCRSECSNLAMALGLASEQGKPVEFRRG